MDTDLQKLSYIIGRQIGGDFRAQGMEINFDDFSQGARSAYLAEESDLDAEESQRIMTTFQETMQAKAEEMTTRMSAENKTLGEAFLAENKTQADVKVTETGLQYKIIESGTGATPELTSTVETHYEGSLIDGTIFDSSYQRGETISFPVNGVIPGWTEALQLMKEGDIWELAIPSELAYGAQGAGQTITPHSTLRFKIELIKVK